jgi:glutamate-1-semialdehyde aminotransferase
MAATVATLEALADGSVHRTIAAHGERLMAGIDARLRFGGGR